VRWRPGDRFRFLGGEYTLVDSADPLPGEAFARDYVDVRVWTAWQAGAPSLFLVTGEFLDGALAVERVSDD
jgi:hypothetical protein